MTYSVIISFRLLSDVIVVLYWLHSEIPEIPLQPRHWTPSPVASVRLQPRGYCIVSADHLGNWRALEWCPFALETN